MKKILSICMMVKDEEKNIRRCCESVKNLCNSIAELIIVDTGSSDNTVSIAKEYTDKVYFHKWNNNFSEMRNITISYATGEWIFILDADEEVLEEDKLKKYLLDKNINKNNTIICNIRNYNDLNDESTVAITPSPRFFKNDGEFKYLGSVHNQPIYKKLEVEGDCPNAELAADNVISLPVHPSLTKEDLDLVIEAVKTASSKF